MAVSAVRSALLFAFLVLLPSAALAQAPTTPAATPDQQLLKAEELDALVAPIALYPDTLLAQVLMASTYPLELVRAERWSRQNKNLKDAERKAAADQQGWDDSVKALLATPSVLSMMSEKLEWTQKLGDAVLAQQPDVMDAIQRLRARAQANKKLSSTKEQKVSVRQEQSRQIIAIEPTDPETVYVPYYDPGVVYGGWPYPAYPPYYFGYPGYIPGAFLAAGIGFGAGYALGRWGSGGNYWGGGINWNNNNININRPRVNPLGGGNWQHNPGHRQGVRYNNPHVAARFGNNSLRGGAAGRMDFRGRGGQQVLRPGAGQLPAGGRPGAGQRPSGGRPSAGQRPSGGRPSAGQRPSGRPSAGQRPSGGRGGGNALGNVSSGRVARAQGGRGRASYGGGGGGGFRGGGGGGFRGGGGGGGGFRGGGGGGGRGGGGGGRGGGGGGRRSDITVKHDLVLLGHLPNGIGFYRFSYNGSNQAYVGVMAQDVQTVMPEAVVRGRDGYLRVFYEKLGVEFQTYQQWIASGAHVPAAVPASH